MYDAYEAVVHRMNVKLVILAILEAENGSVVVDSSVIVSCLGVPIYRLNKLPIDWIDEPRHVDETI